MPPFAFGSPTVSSELRADGFVQATAYGTPEVLVTIPELFVQATGFAASTTLGNTGAAAPLSYAQATEFGQAPNITFEGQFKFQFTFGGVPVATAFAIAQATAISDAGIAVPTGYADVAAFGTPSAELAAGQLSATATGFAVPSSFGDAVVSSELRVTGFDQATGFGGVTILLTYTLSGYAQAVAFGDPAVALTQVIAGYDQAIAFGEPVVSLAQLVTGFAAATDYGTALAAVPAGLPGATAYGAPDVALTVPQPLTAAATGFSVPVTAGGTLAAVPHGLSQAVAIGTPAVTYPGQVLPYVPTQLAGRHRRRRGDPVREETERFVEKVKDYDKREYEKRRKAKAAAAEPQPGLKHVTQISIEEDDEEAIIVLL